MIYNPAKFREGTEVRVAALPDLEEFSRTWTLHHPLMPAQLAYAAATAKVERTYMYHGGDVLYELVGLPGIWHEQCLEAT